MKYGIKYKGKLTAEEIESKIKESGNKIEYRKWLSIKLRLIMKMRYRVISEILSIDERSVRANIMYYRKEGSKSVENKKHKCGRKPTLTRKQELDVLNSLKSKALKGEFVTAKEVSVSLINKFNISVSPTHAYRVLERHNWRKVVPRPVHPKADKEKQEEFKKKFQNLYWLPPENSIGTTKDQSD